MERQRRYPSDLTDTHWEIVEPMLPLIKSPDRIPKHPRRAIVDAILYVVRSGCSWRQLPVDFPPWQTVYWQFQQWEQRQVTERILDDSANRSGSRKAANRSRQPGSSTPRASRAPTPSGGTATRLQTTVEIVRKPAEQRGFAVYPKQWVVERKPGLADRAPPPGPRLRTRPRRLRGVHPLGGDQHHDPPPRPRPARQRQTRRPLNPPE